MFYKKFISLIVITLVTISLLAGCGDSKEASSGDGKNNETNAVTLKLAHQWAAPDGEEGDYRALLAERFAEEVEKQSDGTIKVEVYPANSLLGTDEQYGALQKGSLDMAIWAPFYAAGKEREFSISLMPGIIKSLAQAWEWQNEPIGKEVEDLLSDNGVNMLVWTWAPLTAATVGDKTVVNPEDVAGLKFRGAGTDSEKMLKNLGAGIASMPSSEIYSAMQTGVLDGTLTTYSSFMSYRLYEVVDHFLYTGDNSAIMYAMMPLVISKQSFENKLSDEQRKVIEQVSSDLQEWVVQAVDEDNGKVVQTFRDNGVNVYEISEEQLTKWFEAAQPVVDEFAASSERAKQLIDAARELN